MDIIGGLIDDRQMIEMSLGDRVVWPTGEPVVRITLGQLPSQQFQAQAQLRDAIYAAGGHYTTVQELPFRVVLEGTGYASGLFDGCSSLTTVPDMDTSNVTDMLRMFWGCSSLTTVPDMDTSNVTNMRNMFDRCSNLTTVPAMDTSNATDMTRMFALCSSLTATPDMDTASATSTSNMFRDCAVLYDGAVRLLRDMPPVNVDTSNMIVGSGLTRMPFYNYDGTPLD